MSVDRKRLRDLARAANARGQVVMSARTLVALLDALDAAEQPAPEDARLELEWLWANCHIVYWPKGDPQPYPIEHNLRASKNSRDLIEAAIAEQEERT